MVVMNLCIIYIDTFPPTYHIPLFVGLRPLLLLLLFFRVSEVSAGLVIYFRTPFALVVLFFFFLLFFTLRLKPCTLLFNKTCSLTAGGEGRPSSLETKRKSIWPKSTHPPALQNFTLGIIIYSLYTGINVRW
jgi:hypothetical protein